jgi:hypothetical protein
MNEAQGQYLPVRPRAFLLGIALAAAICAITPYQNVYKQGTPLGGGHFPLAPFFLFFWLTLFAGAAGRLFKRAVLTGREVLTIWMLTVLVSGIAYTGLVRTFFLNLTAPFHFATVGNGWREVLQPLLPAAWFPGDEGAVKLFYNGLADGRRMGWLEVLGNIPWATWIGPLLVWGAFVLLCYGVMICLVTLLSRQWIRNERLNMPLLRVPRMMEEALDQHRLGGFLADRFLLAGLAIPVLLHLINGLAFYYPTVPQIPTLILAGPYFPKYGLFSGFHKLKIHIYPAFIGFAFLASRQISFSFWVFFVLGGLLFGLLSILGYNIPSAALGTTFGPTLSRPEETQMVGAYLVFFLFLIWLARHHLLAIIRAAAGRGDYSSDETEWMPAPVAFWGAVGGGLLVVLWLNYFGVPLAGSALIVATFFIFMLVASRVIVQGGVAYFTLTVAPIDGLLAFFGPGLFSRAGLVAAAVVQKVLFVDLRESLMPSLVHAAGVTHRTRNRRTVFGVMCLVLGLGLAVSFVAMLALCYKFGARELRLDWATRTVTTVYGNVVTLLEAPDQSREWVVLFSTIGGVVMLGLVICYHRFIWWPLHPVGYLTAYSSAMRILWFSFFVGWLCNSLCIRYGGVKLFRRLRLFFVGLIIGDFLMGGIWATVGLFTDLSYLVLPD